MNSYGFLNSKLTLRVPGWPELEEVRLRDVDDPTVFHLWGYRWVAGPEETIDFSSYIRTIEIRPPRGAAE